MRTTDRGFTIYDEFVDSRESNVRIQQSSRADDEYLWVFCLKGNELANEPLHLTVKQAERLRDALQAWLEECYG